jgi:hypothetical protein
MIRIHIVRDGKRQRPRRTLPKRRTLLALFAIAALVVFVPLAAAQTFTDVPTTHPFYNQIERAYAAGMIGACAGSPPPPNQTFCPGNFITKGSASNQYDKAFGLDGTPRPFTPTWRNINIITGGSIAPFTVDSQVKVDNLNADLLDGLDSAAFAPANLKVTGTDQLNGGVIESTNTDLTASAGSALRATRSSTLDNGGPGSARTIRADSSSANAATLLANHALGNGVAPDSCCGFAVWAFNHSTQGIGVDGASGNLTYYYPGLGIGVFGSGLEGNGVGVYGYHPGNSTADVGGSGVIGESDAAQGQGVAGYGYQALTGTSQLNNGAGVFARASGANATGGDFAGTKAGVVGSGTGANADGGQFFGTGDWKSAVYGVGQTYGSYSVSSGTPTSWSYGSAAFSEMPGGYGVYGSADASSGYGEGGSFWSSSPDGYGIVGGVAGGGTGYAGWFSGPVHVTGNLDVTGTITKGGGSFRITNPLNKKQWLSHSFVESPDMMNVYNGNVRTDAKGFATVKLPDYFQALNREFRYQLTVVGRSFARAIVWDKISGNHFTIRTDEPRVEVSWQVTGIRHDKYANQHRIRVITRKGSNAAAATANAMRASGPRSPMAMPRPKLRLVPRPASSSAAATAGPPGHPRPVGSPKG